MTRLMIEVLVSCALTWSQMLPKMFKPREVSNFIQGNGPHVPTICRETADDPSEGEEVGKGD